MHPIQTFSIPAALVAVALALTGPALAEQQGAGLTTPREVRTEISNAFDAVGDYAVQQRKQAVARAKEAMTKLDAELERRQDALRDAWGEMNQAARADARTAMRDLRQARNRLGERFGALEAGADEAWDELTNGFARAYRDLSETWTQGDAAVSDKAD